jgi:hypothetical protein
VPLGDADLTLNNANWSKGCLSMAEWCWTGNMIPQAVPGFLGQFFVQIPGVLEQQLHYSVTLIFDEPSFRNGIQISGFLERVTKELLTNLIAQRRRCWYTANHHAFLGRLTANKHGLPEDEFTAKWANLTEHESHPEHYTRVERAALAFADAFATNPKAYTDAQYAELRTALAEDNRRRFPLEGLWLARLQAARKARAGALTAGADEAEALENSRVAADAVPERIPDDLNERTVNAQIVEMAFHCLNYLTLSTVFTGLSVPDEPPFADFMAQTVPAPVIEHINALNRAGGEGMEALVPPPVDLPLNEIRAGRVVVAPATLRGARVPRVSYEDPRFADRDRGLTVGGVHMAAWTSASGRHSPSNLALLLLHHPELARFAPSYELPLTSNEDQWRNGVQTAGYVSPRLKELAGQKICRLVRSRWAIDHFTLAMYRANLNEYSAGAAATGQAREAAVAWARDAVLHAGHHTEAPKGVFSALERSLLSWTEDLVVRPHNAYRREAELRAELDRENQREIAAGLRRLDTSPGLQEEAARERLLHHQIAELSLLIGHKDAQCRLATILRLESEKPSQAVAPFGPRPGLHDQLRELGVDDAVLSLNELTVNPAAAASVRERLASEEEAELSAADTASSAEF